MATKSYSKHKEYKEYSSSGSVPYTDEQLDMIKTDLLPKGSKLNSLGRNGTGAGAGTREYHYEYKEEKLPSGKYDRKDMRTVEEFTIPQKSVPKAAETTYYYEREERDLPAINSGTRTYNYESSISSTPGYSKVKSSKATKDLSHNVEELDSLLDDLQKDQERQLYKSGYTSDTAESTSFDYRKGVPKAPSSGYSTLKREERLETSSWGSSPPPAPAARASEIRQELYREEKTESRVVPSQLSPAVPIAVPAPVCGHCHHVTSNTSTLSRSSTPMNKVTTTVKTYTYEVPADQDPTTVPLPPLSDQERYVSTTENIRTSTNTTKLPASLPVPVSPTGCQYCSHCNTHITRDNTLTRDIRDTNTLTRDIRDTREYRTHVTTDVTDHTSERILYPSPVNETKLLPSDPHNGHSPYAPTAYKYSETTYSSQNSSRPTPSPGPFPRPTTPSPGNQQTPKKLDDLLADFPEARFPTQPDGITRRKVEVTHESSRAQNASPNGLNVTPVSTVKPTPIGGSRNVAGPAVYYPPGHVPFEKKDSPAVVGGGYGASSAMQAGGGRYAHGRGMYEYESGSKSKEKHSETKTAVPICLPLCCAMPCVIM